VVKAIALLGEKPTLYDTDTYDHDKPPNTDEMRVGKRIEEVTYEKPSKRQKASTHPSRHKGLSTIIPPEAQKGDKKVRKHSNNDIPDEEDDYKRPQDTPQRQPMETGRMGRNLPRSLLIGGRVKTSLSQWIKMECLQ
jgi:hypothetical protein